jgi:uncharacterized protein YjeT (DUF2065 family)
MKDIFSLILGLLFIGVGLSWIIKPLQAHHVVSPEQTARDRKKFRGVGVYFLAFGAVLLIFYFIELFT